MWWNWNRFPTKTNHMFRSYRGIPGNYRVPVRHYRIPARRMIIRVAGFALGVCVSIFLIVQYGHGIDRGHRGSRIYRVNSYEQFLKQEPGKVVLERAV